MSNLSEKLVSIKAVVNQLGLISYQLGVAGKGLGAAAERLNAVIVELNAAISLLTLGLKFESHNFKVNSDGWKKIIVDGKGCLQNPEGDIWEILDGGCAGEQLFTWDAAIREVAKAGKRMPTDEELSELLKTKDDMPNIVYAGYRDTNTLIINQGTGANIWSSSEIVSDARARCLILDNTLVYRPICKKLLGFSVRCVELSE